MLFITNPLSSFFSCFSSILLQIATPLQGFSSHQPPMPSSSISSMVVTDSLYADEDMYDYDFHLFLYYKNADSWPRSFDASDADPFLKLFISTWKARKNDIPMKAKLSVCEVREGSGFSDGEVLVFPDSCKYSRLVESNVEKFFENLLVNGKGWNGGYGVSHRSRVFVCAHGSRDVECGQFLINKFNEEIALRDLKDHVFVTACSHVGWDKYPGNVVIYTFSPKGETMGHWYGYVSTDDVPDLLDLHIAKGEVIPRLLRGQMVAEAQTCILRKIYYCRSMQMICEDDVRQYEQDEHKIFHEEDTNKGKNNLTVVCVLGGVAAAVVVAYKFYRRSSLS